MNQSTTVAIIGAGIAGLSCAAELERQGLSVELFDKGRRPGGRVATRHTPEGIAFDHGAQYFTVRSREFFERLTPWREAGRVEPWRGRIMIARHGAILPEHAPTERFVGVPEMNSLPAAMSAGLVIHIGSSIARVEKDPTGWHLSDAAGQTRGPFSQLVCATPPEQAKLLIRNCSHPLSARLDSVQMAPCWAVLLRFARPLPATFDGAFVEDSPLRWVARNSSKPGRNESECWVLHASAEWSQEHLEDAAAEVTDHLSAAFWHATGLAPVEPHSAMGHRWRYALPVMPLSERCLFDGEVRLGLCGDWCGGPRVEGAYLSGLELARRIAAGIR